MYRLAFGLQPKKVLLPAPAFVEYEEALSAAGAQIEYYRMTEDFIIKEDILEQITFYSFAVIDLLYYKGL